MSDITVEFPDDIPQDELEYILIGAPPGFLDGTVAYWKSQAPTTILQGAREFDIHAEALESYRHDLESSESDLDRALRAIAWYLFTREGVRSNIRKVKEQRNRERDGADVIPASGKAESRPDPEK